MKIKKIIRKNISGKVYNIGTLPNHNYIVEGQVVHNCYQNSTPEGVHADLKEIKIAVDMVSDYSSKIVEFAIGGGEPTEHPEFVQILGNIKKNNNIANFTTKSTKWLNDPKILRAVKDMVTGIAYSVDTLEEFQEFKKLHYEAFPVEGGGPTMYIHLIPEIMDHDNFRRIIQEVEEHNEENWMYTEHMLRITLLGFKTIGRAQNMQREPQPEIVDIITRLKRTPVGIDTKFAEDYQSFLDEHNIDRKLYTTEEGEFSMYVDVVNQKAYKSSWHLDNPIEYRTQDWRRFRKIEKVFGDIKKIEGENNDD